MQKKKKKPCPNCNQDIFMFPGRCPYCDVSLSLYTQPFSQESIDEARRLVKNPPKGSQIPGFVRIWLLGSLVLLSAFLGFLSFMAVNYAPLLVLPPEYAAGTVPITVFPATVAAMLTTFPLVPVFCDWVEAGIKYPRKFPDVSLALVALGVSGAVVSIYLTVHRAGLLPW